MKAGRQARVPIDQEDREANTQQAYQSVRVQYRVLEKTIVPYTQTKWVKPIH